MESRVSIIEQSRVLTVSELSDYLRIHRSTCYRLIKQGLPYFRMGADYRFNREQIEQWIALRSVNQQ